MIQRKDTPTSDHLSVVVDNARQSVTPVTRGRDFLPATGLHRLLQVLLDLAQSIYHHHDLLTDDTGRKLSKTARDASIESLRDQGVNPDEIRRRVGC